MTFSFLFSAFSQQIMDSKTKESLEDPDYIEILENLSKDLKQISQSFHDMQVRAAILNVEIGILFDPEAVNAIKESQETCIKCSHRMNEVIEKPIDLLVNEDVKMDG
eukprot:Seg7152.1 transcript_id=Seg7152.1/GoldUCD/mRNA.D3Y31 product="hypothetical protein" protein_id=Seg7152.1/GoldUCD/D3Y31